MKRSRLLLSAIIIMAASACAGRNLLLDPSFQPEISNQPDSFEFQVTDVNGVTDVVQFTWQNTNTTATVDHSSSITGGSATLTILDSVGQQMYLEPLTPSGNDAIGSGTPGDWTIIVAGNNVRGTLNFRVQSP